MPVTLIPKTANLSGMDIAVDFNNMMAEHVGTEHGLASADIEKLSAEIQKSGGFHDQFQVWRQKGQMAFIDLLYDTDALGRIKDLAEVVRDRFENFVVLGIGGSALGAMALQQALAPFYYNELDHGDRGGCPRMFFCDNIDPVQFTALLRRLPLEKTVFNVISKSGATAETLAQFLVVRRALEEALGPEAMKDHLIVTTDPRQGDLRAVCNSEDLEGLSIPSGVGGRFSCLSPVGLFPAAVAGLDVDGVIGGARMMDQRCRRKDVWENPAYLNAALGYLFDTQRRKHVHVLLSYSESLVALGDWYVQLQAESLGKAGMGPTPLRARGVSDQHSQLQLWLDGPNDKIFWFIGIEKFSAAGEIPPTRTAYQNYASLSFLGGKSLEQLLHSERFATESALTARGRPNATIRLPVLCAETFGQLLFLLEMQTAFSGLLYGVNPFDQPAVELGKRLTYHLMGRRDFEKRPDELIDYGKKSARFLI